MRESGLADKIKAEYIKRLREQGVTLQYYSGEIDRAEYERQMAEID